MAHANYCGSGIECSDCKIHECPVDLTMPCSPSCKNLHENMIDIRACAKAGCIDNLCYMFYGEYDESRTDDYYINRLCRDYLLDNGMAIYPYSVEHRKLYTREYATDIVNLVEDVLDRYGIKVPSPEDDERDEDNSAAFYGSVYSELLDNIEVLLIRAAEDAKYGIVIQEYCPKFD